MSESNQLVPQDLQDGDLAQFDDMTKAATYLPRLQLFGANSGAVVDGKIPMAHWGLVMDDEVTDLGEEVNVVIVTFRAKATDTGGDVPISMFDPEEEAFQDIKDRSEIKDSGCMYGNEFLVWIPDAGTFATYHMNSKTARREAKKMKPLIGGGATLKCRLIDPPASKYKWHGPVITVCSAPLTPPDEDEVRRQYTKFKNPPKTDVEVVGDGEDDRAR